MSRMATHEKWFVGGVLALVVGLAGIKVWVAEKIYGDWTCAISACRREVPLK